MKFNIAMPKSIHSKPMLLTKVPLNAGPTKKRNILYCLIRKKSLFRVYSVTVIFYSYILQLYFTVIFYSYILQLYFTVTSHCIIDLTSLNDTSDFVNPVRW